MNRVYAIRFCNLVSIVILLIVSASYLAHADTVLNVTPGAGVDQYRSTKKIGNKPTIAECWAANRVDKDARPYPQFPKTETYGCDPLRESGKITWTPPPPSTPAPVATWTYVGREWDTFVMPYDGVARFKDLSPAAEAAELIFPKDAVVRCNEVKDGGPFPRPEYISWRSQCEIHPAGVKVPPPTVSLTMMAQMPGMPVVDPSKVPAPTPAALTSSEFRVRPSTEVVATGHEDGKFRMNTSYSHMNFDDFIVNPNKPGTSHLHIYYGNVKVNAFSTVESLKLCTTTNAGGSANCSAYWTPALLMPDLSNTGKYVPLIPVGADFYYSTSFGAGDPKKIQWLPNGLKAVGGALPTNTDPNAMPRGTYWDCTDGPQVKVIPTCPPGTRLAMHIAFPTCWDGQNLDSPDHRSHLNSFDERGLCPPSHPVQVTELSLHIWYKIPPGVDSATLRLSCDQVSGPGGTCLHADVVEQIDESIRDEALEICVRQHGSCQDNTGKRELY